MRQDISLRNPASWYRAGVLALILLGVFTCGCEEGWHARTHPVTGSLFINGAPAENAIVQLISVGEKVDQRNSRPWGLVQADGTFTLSTYRRGDGAPVGQYQVILSWPVNPHVLGSPDRLGRRFDDVEESRWRVTIQKGTNILEPIRLTGVPVTNPSDP